MDQVGIPICSSLKSKNNYIDEVCGGGQTQCNASAESWLDQIKSTFDPSHQMWQISEKVCIYRVCKMTMISKPEAYIPLVVSFGPYHHKINSKFSKIDQHKLEAVHIMLKRSNVDVTELIGEIQKLECEIRQCYEEPIDLDSETLSWMFAMDSCFILEFLRTWDDTNYFSLVFQKGLKENSMCRAILDDIIKVENQIPLFILITILQLEFGTPERATTKLAAMLSIFQDFRGFPFLPLSYDDAFSKLKELIETKPLPCHLLDLNQMVIKDLLINSNAESGDAIESDTNDGADYINNDYRRFSWLMNLGIPGWMQRLRCIDILRGLYPRLFSCSGSTSNAESHDDRKSTPCAELLHKAGIRFEPGQLGFQKKRFGKATLSLPRIIVVDSTDISFRNLMAYEECQRCSWRPEETVISHFVRLLDDLIDSEKDVSLLRKSQVVESWVGSDDDTARMINRLCDGITFSSVKYFEEVMKKARDHYKSQWKVLLRQFKQEHFSKPWYVFSLGAATALLVMTFIQTMYAVKK